MTEPVVSVVVPTYNHERWIAAALDSVLAQRTPFGVEIIVSEDASTDGTRAVVTRFAADHPDRVRPILSPRNVRSNEVVARGLRAARGRYVCLLDGDDLWTDPDKLARQVAFLDAHPDCSAVFFNALIAEDAAVTARRWTRADLPARLGLPEIWEGNPYATCAGMLRADCVRHMPDWYADFFPITDWPLYVACARQGALAFVDEVCGVYRLHGGGLFSALAARQKRDQVEGFYRLMLRHLRPEEAALARRGYSRYFLDWAEAHLKAGELGPALDCYRRGLRGRGASLSRSARLALALLRGGLDSQARAVPR